MKLTIKKAIASLYLVLASGFIMAPALAQTYDFSSQSGLNETGVAAGYDTGNEAPTVEGYVSRIITIVLSLLGVIFLGLTIYAGLIWMMAQGNEARVSKAKELLTEAVIGVLVVLAAYAISIFVLKATTGTLLK
ncbi:MAG: hypothetical protein ACM3PZ_00210 [Bacillota bacterium]